MVIKRKRSDSEMSSISNGSILSSPPPFNAMEFSFSSPFNSQRGRELTPSHLSSRTRKRYRDNRPSESAVHEHTLSMLYSAQQNPQLPAQTSEAPAPQPATVRNYSSLSSQTSLHSFWALPSRSSSCSSSEAASSSPPPNLTHQSTSCEDCATTLMSANGDAMDVDMDIDMYSGSNDYGCTQCGKQVCHSCAISNLGAQRRCLNCASKRKWVGGLGWMDQD